MIILGVIDLTEGVSKNAALLGHGRCSVPPLLCENSGLVRVLIV